MSFKLHIGNIDLCDNFSKMGFFLIFFTSIFALLSSDSAHALKATENSLDLLIQSGHSESIEAVAFSPNGRYIATASRDKTVRLWDFYTGVTIKTLEKHTDTVTSIAFSHNGKYLATGSVDATVIVWDIDSGQEVTAIRGAPIQQVLFSKDDRYVVTGGNDIQIWDTITGEEIKSLNWVRPGMSFSDSIALSPDGGTMISVGSALGVIWDFRFGIGQPFTESAQWVDIGPQGKRFITVHGNSAKIWDMATKKDVASLQGRGKALFSPDGSCILFGSSIYDAKSFRKRFDFRSPGRIGFRSAQFSPDGKYVLEGRADGQLYLWSAKTGTVIRNFGGKKVNIWSVSFSHDGNYLVTGGGTSTINRFGMKHIKEGNLGRITLWDLRKGEAAEIKQGAENVHFVSFDTASDSLVAVDKYFINVWDRNRISRIKDYNPYIKENISSAAMSKDGRYIAVGGEGNGSIVLIDTEKKKLPRTFKASLLSVHSISFSPDGRFIAAGDTLGNAQVWDVGTGTSVLSMEGPGRHMITSGFGVQSACVAFSPDGKYLFKGRSEKGGGVVLSTGTWKTVQRIKDANIWNAAFSHDSRYLATAGADSMVRLWDITNGKETARLSGHKADVWTVTFSADGKLLASGSFDGMVKIWDVDNAQEIMSMISLGQDNYAMVTPDGYYKTSKSTLRDIYFVRKKDAYTFENFDLIYNRPDIIIDRLGRADKCLVHAYRKAYEKRVRKAGFSGNGVDQEIIIPVIDILTENIPIETDNRTFSFKVNARDEEYTIDRMQVLVNDVPLFGTQGMSVAKEKSKDVTVDIRLQLSWGFNKIMVSAFNEMGIESLKKQVLIKYNGEYRKPDLYVAVVGVSDYSTNGMDLKYAAKDAKDFLEIMKGRKDVFGEIYTLSLFDTEATGQRIKELAKFFEKTKVDDTAVLFMAGHGVLDDDLSYYFAPTDIRIESLGSSGIPYEVIEDAMDGIQSRNKLVLLDTCHAGEVDDETEVTHQALGENVKVINTFDDARALRRAVFMQSDEQCRSTLELRKELFAQLQRGTGAVVLSSSSGVELAYESAMWNNGVFTFSVLDSMRSGKADMNYDGEITISEMIDYVVKRVQKLTKGKQTPTVRNENRENDFRIY